MPPTMPQRLLAGFAACAALTFSACTTLGPDYTEPKVAWLETWETDLYGQFGGTAQQKEADVLASWHNQFSDV